MQRVRGMPAAIWVRQENRSAGPATRESRRGPHPSSYRAYATDTACEHEGAWLGEAAATVPVAAAVHPAAARSARSSQAPRPA